MKLETAERVADLMHKKAVLLKDMSYLIDPGKKVSVCYQNKGDLYRHLFTINSLDADFCNRVKELAKTEIKNRVDVIDALIESIEDPNNNTEE